MEDLIDLFTCHLGESHPKGDSHEYVVQRTKAETIYNDLEVSLNNEQKEKLSLLRDEYFMLQGCESGEYFNYGFKIAFKFILQTLII